MCKDKGANLMSWHLVKGIYRRAGFGGWKDDEITLRWAEFKTPGLLRGVVPFRCEAQLMRDPGWCRGLRRRSQERRGSCPSLQVCFPVGNMKGLD